MYTRRTTSEQRDQQLAYQKQAYRRDRQLWDRHHQFKQELSREEKEQADTAKAAKDARMKGLRKEAMPMLADHVRSILSLRCPWTWADGTYSLVGLWT